MFKNALQERLKVSPEEIAAFCRRWQIVELSLFGSVLRDDFKPDSDIDALVVFAPDSRWTLFDHVQMETELGGLLARKVDLVSKRAIEQSRNWLRRKEILTTARPIYATRYNGSPGHC